MSAWIALVGLGLWLLAFARYLWVAHPRQAPALRVGFLDLPLGLATSFHLDLPAVVARERLRSALLRTGVFTLRSAGASLEFRRATPSPWLGTLWSSKSLPIYVGSLECSGPSASARRPAEPSSSLECSGPSASARRPAEPSSLRIEAETAEGCRVIVRFSTVPIAGWALIGAAVLEAPMAASFFAGRRGPWLWIAIVALLLAVRSVYQAEARRLAWRLLDRLI